MTIWKFNDVSFMTNLKILAASSSSGAMAITKEYVDMFKKRAFDKSGKLKMSRINQLGIRGLNLFKLNACDNAKITDVSFMTNLQFLDASNKYGICGINQKGIRGLNLRYFRVWDNNKIKNVWFISRLHYLDARGKKCGINDKGIGSLKIMCIMCEDNKKLNGGSSFYHH